MAIQTLLLWRSAMDLLRPGSCVLLSLLIITCGPLCSTSETSHIIDKRQAGVPANPQNPQVFQALDQLRGNEALSATQVQQVLAASYPGSSYPTYSYIPQTSFSCNQVRQFGFYADPETRCQVFRRCEANNFMFSYICPNGTVFNQITLVCDWFFNVNCPSTGGFFDYSNPRIYRQDLKLFDDYYGNGLGYGGGGTGGGYGGGGYGYAMSGSGPVPSVSDTGSSSNAQALTSSSSSNTASGSQSNQQNGQYRRVVHKDSDTILI